MMAVDVPYYPAWLEQGWADLLAHVGVVDGHPDSPSTYAPAVPATAWLTCVGSLVLVGATYLVHGHLFLALDLLRAPDFLYAHKIQKDKVVTRKQLGRMYPMLLTGFLAALVPGAVILGLSGALRVDVALPPVSEVALSFVAFALLEEVGFYYTHRALHMFYYSDVHKIHHEFKAPIALAAAYAHPLETITGNIAPILLIPCMLRAHLFTAWLWFLAAVVATQLHHSGYTWAWPPSVGGFPEEQPDFHDFHHHPAFTSNFGLLGILDRLHGTDSAWRAVLAKKQRSR